MRVALVCPYDLDRHGGVQDQVLRLKRWLAEAEHDAWIVAPGTGGPPGTVHVGASIGVPINRSVAPVSIDPRIAGDVRDAVARADVVHIHEPLVPVVGLAALMAETPPKVVTFHADPSRLVTGIYRLAAPLFRGWIGRAAVASAVSERAASAVRGMADVRVIPNGIDVADYAPGTAPRRANRVAFLGRDDPRKGLDVLIEAWARVRDVMPDAQLTVMGTARESIIPGVEWLGRVDEETKRRGLQESAVYCAPNTGGESFGIVLVEAMAAGCAVVASDLAAFAAVVGEAGMLVPAGDADALAGTLISLLQSPDLTAELGARAITRAARFDRSSVLPAYVTAYEQAIGAG